MKTYTVHLHRRKPPVLVPERFSWGALFFGPLWLLWHHAWIAAVLAVAVLFLACTVPPPPFRPLIAFTVMLLLGLLGNDIRRWHLGFQRFHLGCIVAGRNHDEALFRLLSHRTDLLGQAA